jgi:hypothetical protein
MTCFRTCSTCGSRSQARFSHCSLRTISDRPKRTFVLLRYRLGGDRPSQTACHARSPTPLQGPRLEPQRHQGGISTTAPRELASAPHSLPPILHKSRQSPMQSYSKGSWGLSVLPRGDCIFTNISTSLSPKRRQCGHRYAIRAGRNLPDKEFRYLRTVIVTAAVYRGFDQALARHQLTFRHRAGVTPYTSAFAFAECCVFVKQSQPPILCDPLPLRPQGTTRTRGTPSPEVTVSICRVPSPGFSQAPENFHPAHLCRFAVRSTHN